MDNKLFMTTIVLLTAALLLTLLLNKERKNNPFDGKHKLPYFRRRLMTPTEFTVYQTLIKTLPEFLIFPQVQASRVLDIPQNKDNYYWFNFISRLSYDFVVCRQDSTPIAIIEIDDATHENAKRQEADNRKNKATKAAGVAVIRWAVGQTPSSKEIKTLIHNINKKAA